MDLFFFFRFIGHFSYFLHPTGQKVATNSRESRPSILALQDQEKILKGNLFKALRIEEEAVRQKSRVHWHESGNRITAFFHNAIKNRRNRKRIMSVVTLDGLQTKDEGEAKSEAIRYFKSMVGTLPDNHYPGIDTFRSIIHKMISQEHY